MTVTSINGFIQMYEENWAYNMMNTKLNIIDKV